MHVFTRYCQATILFRLYVKCPYGRLLKENILIIIMFLFTAEWNPKITHWIRDNTFHINLIASRNNKSDRSNKLILSYEKSARCSPLGNRSFQSAIIDPHQVGQICSRQCIANRLRFSEIYSRRHSSVKS